jgi:multidrug efflux pump subunit AcrB
MKPITLLLLSFAVLIVLVAAGVFFVARPLVVFFTTPLDELVEAKGLPVIVVETVSPGANARVVAETVAAPIEAKVHGMEGMRSMRSRCGNDGSYILLVTLERHADLSSAQLLVQNRISLAVPALPIQVQEEGISVRNKSPSPTMLLSLSSDVEAATGKPLFDSHFLWDYAATQIKDELVRIPGVGDVTGLGGPGDHPRVNLDLEKMAAQGVTVSAVARVLRQQFRPELNRRLTGVDEIREIVLKVGADGAIVRLRDVAGIDIALGHPHAARLNGKPVIILGIHPIWRTHLSTFAALNDWLAQQRLRLPKGISLDLAFDFTPNVQVPDKQAIPEYLLLDVDQAADASEDRTSAILGHAEELLRPVETVKDVLNLSENPFDLARNRPCILVRLAPSNGQRASQQELTQAIRTRLEAIKEARLRFRDLYGLGRFPRCSYPLDLALCGPDEDKLRKWAEKLTERLLRHKKLSDVCLNPDFKSLPTLDLVIDHDATTKQGVSVADVSETVKLGLGSLQINGYDGLGGKWHVAIEAFGERSLTTAERLKRLNVRNGKGQLVTVATFVTLREIQAPGAIDRLDGQAMAEIFGNPATGVSLAEAQTLCQNLAEEVRKELQLPKEYRCTWLGDAL